MNQSIKNLICLAALLVTIFLVYQAGFVQAHTLTAGLTPNSQR